MIRQHNPRDAGVHKKKLPAPIFDSSVPFVSRSAPRLQSGHGANGVQP